MKAIVYSLFGYGNKNESCFEFNSYLRGLMICLRMNQLIYPEWKTILQIDKNSLLRFENLFFQLQTGLMLKIEVNEPAPLCEAMLWRLRPAFNPEYTHILCRDLDSPATYRERQAVESWISKDKAMHAITDSISHTVPLLGGMIGVIPKYFTGRMGINKWSSMMGLAQMNFEGKGSDQDFLNQIIYPKFAQPGADSITQHYFNGYGNTFLSDFHTCTCPPPAGHREDCPNNFKIDLPDEMKESNSICGHIGAAGWYETATFKFLRKHWNEFLPLLEIEKEYPTIFGWVNE